MSVFWIKNLKEINLIFKVFNSGHLPRNFRENQGTWAEWEQGWDFGNREGRKRWKETQKKAQQRGRI